MYTNIPELRAEMGRRNLSYSRLAKAAGITPSTMTRRIRGTTEFSLPEIWRISDVLELSNEKILSIFFAQ